MRFPSRFVIAIGLILTFGATRASAVGVATEFAAYHAKNDVSLQILPRDGAPEIFNVDKDELIVPALVRPKGIDTANQYEAIEALKQDGKPLTLWFRRDLSRYRPLRLDEIYVEVFPKWKTNEATIFALPGKSYVDCQVVAKVKACIAWPQKGTPLKFVSAKLVESLDPSDQLIKWRLFYQVQYKYKNRAGRLVQGTGWILSEDVIAEERRLPDQQSPPPAAPSPSGGSPLHQLNPALTEAVAPLIPHLGDCLAQPGKLIRLSTIRTTVSPAWTETLLPYWRNIKLANPPVLKEIKYNDHVVTTAELIAIDTLARTIYGEMATCNFSTGSGYMMAVAKVILNRVDESYSCQGRKSLFMCVKPEVAACKKLNQPEFINDLIQVMIKPSQFSTWNNERKQDLRRVLCPSGRREEDKQKDGKPANKFDVDNWQDSVKIALEAVLDTDAFKKKTAEVTATFYVSAQSGIEGHVRMNEIPTVLGQRLDRGRCIKFLKPIKASQSKCVPIPEEREETAEGKTQ